MSPEEFRQHGHQVIDWIADYWDGVADLPVLAQVQPGEVTAQLPTVAPDLAESFDAVLKDLDRIVVPGLTHWQHPRYFAYFPANSSPAAILGDLISSGIGAQGMIWATSPAVTELEQVVLDWFAKALGLPEAFLNLGDGTGGRWGSSRTPRQRPPSPPCWRPCIACQAVRRARQAWGRASTRSTGRRRRTHPC